MKKFIYFIIAAMCISCSTTQTINGKKKWYESDSRIEVINETTVIFKNVDKIEIKSNTSSLVTYVYDLNHSKLMKVARGSFNVNLSKGDYLVQ